MTVTPLTEDQNDVKDLLIDVAIFEDSHAPSKTNKAARKGSGDTTTLSVEGQQTFGSSDELFSLGGNVSQSRNFSTISYGMISQTTDFESSFSQLSRTGENSDSSGILDQIKNQNIMAEENAERVTAMERILTKLYCDLAEARSKADWYKLQHRKLHLEYQDLQAFCEMLQDENQELREGGGDTKKGGWFVSNHKSQKKKYLKEKRRLSYQSSTNTSRSSSAADDYSVAMGSSIPRHVPLSEASVRSSDCGSVDFSVDSSQQMDESKSRAHSEKLDKSRKQKVKKDTKTRSLTRSLSPKKNTKATKSLSPVSPRKCSSFTLPRTALQLDEVDLDPLAKSTGEINFSDFGIYDERPAEEERGHSLDSNEGPQTMPDLRKQSLPKSKYDPRHRVAFQSQQSQEDYPGSQHSSIHTRKGSMVPGMEELALESFHSRRDCDNDFEEDESSSSNQPKKPWWKNILREKHGKKPKSEKKAQLSKKVTINLDGSTGDNLLAAEMRKGSNLFGSKYRYDDDDSFAGDDDGDLKTDSMSDSSPSSMEDDSEKRETHVKHAALLAMHF